MQPTEEQQAVIDAALGGDDLTIQAGAGTGKTSTLLGVALVLLKPTEYTAFTNATIKDAAKVFPSHVTCRTAHSHAFRTVSQAPRALIKKRLPSWQLAEGMGLRKKLYLFGKNTSDEVIEVKPAQLVRIAYDTVRAFSHSADPELLASHVPYQHGISGIYHRQLREVVYPLATHIWDDLCDVEGTLPFEHDHYVKMWALTDPVIATEVIMLDEAQDTNPVLAAVIERQTHAQRIICGDSCQQMYGWRQAVDALESFASAQTLYLSRSWRFGASIAQEANKWLALLDTPLRLVGNPEIDSQVTTVRSPDAVLCRSNAGALGAIMGLMEQNRRTAMVGGGAALQYLAEAARDLQSGRRTSHHELFAFPDWDAVVEYARTETSGRDLRPLVNLIDTHGIETVISLTKALVSESAAQTTVSTVHRAKGRQWSAVRCGEDFYIPDPGETLSSAEAMVGYVAVTRARYQLDRGALSWVDGPSEDGEYGLD